MKRPNKKTGGFSAVPASRGSHQKAPLYSLQDQGSPLTLRVEDFAPPPRGGGWGPFAESFVRFNQSALQALDVRVETTPGPDGAALRLLPGSRVGAVPLRSALTGRVAGGVLVHPRFGWAGVGQILGTIGWHAMPEFLDFPLVPGSGREVPPWVLAGPIVTRLEALLRSLRAGYQEVETIQRHPRGQILWPRYRRESLATGRWDRLPCRFFDLALDPKLRQYVRWSLERLYHDLVVVGADDPLSGSLTIQIAALLEQVKDVVPQRPSKEWLSRSGSTSLLPEALRLGVEAIAWVVEERGLGGGFQQDGLAWALPLDRLWESYVESMIRKEVALTGGEIRVGRKGETTFPVLWTDPMHRSLGHLEPDIVVRRGPSIWIVDAKYKAHLAELDRIGWYRFSEEMRNAHRADLHQVLAYAALFDAQEITTTLMYPLPLHTWNELHQRAQETSHADLLYGGRRLRLELRGIPFGSASQMG